jgi:epoxyqueuosine reductase
MLKAIQQEMRGMGYRIQQVSIKHLEDLRREIEDLHKNQSFHPEFSEVLTKLHSYELPDVAFNIQSILIVASPCAQVKVVFNRDQKKYTCIIPPTYLDYAKEPVHIEEALNKILSGRNLHAKRVEGLPEKLLAAKSGLSAYGKNNISYVEGMGSFTLLSAYYSDLPCSEENWNEVRIMDSCKDCMACVKSCMTGAIATDRYLIRAERCITYHNEFNTDPYFPEWIDPSWHNCIIGCMRCQTCCPRNREYLKNVTEPFEFSMEDTALILEGKPVEELSEGLILKLKQLNLFGYYNLLARNLKVLFR